MRQRIEQLNKQVHSVLGRRDVWMEEKEAIQKENKRLLQEIRWGKGAYQIATTVGETLQAQISKRLSAIATYLLECVFPDPYTVKLQFTSSGRGRGNIEASILFSYKGEEFKPVLPSGQFLAGGGPIETGAFGLRCGIWAQTAASSSRPIFFLDEPFRFVQKDLQGLVAETMKELAQKMEVQFILVTHEEIANMADNIIVVESKEKRRKDALLRSDTKTEEGVSFTRRRNPVNRKRDG